MDILFGNIEDYKILFSAKTDKENEEVNVYGYEIAGVGVVMSFVSKINFKGFTSSVLVPNSHIEEVTDDNDNIISRKVVED